MESPTPRPKTIDLDEIKKVVTSLGLTSVNFERYLLVMRSECDLVICGEPYTALLMWLDTESGRYMARVWNQTVSTGSAAKADGFLEACESHFMSGRPCIGFPKVHEHLHQDFQVSQTPIPRLISRTCHRTLGRDAGPSVHSCPECMKLRYVSAQVKEEKYEGEDYMMEMEDEEQWELKPDLDYWQDDLSTDEKAPRPQDFKSPKIQEEPNEDSGRCPRCNIRVPAEEMQDHNQRCLEIVGNKLHDCTYPDCGKRFGTLQNLQHHKEEHKGTKGPNPCDLCGQEFKSQKYLQRHQRISHSSIASQVNQEDSENRLHDDSNNGSLECSFPNCGKSFKTARSRERHEEGHKSIKSFPCSMCEKVLSSLKFLQYHIKATHPDIPRTYGCTECPMEFAKPCDRRYHMNRVHFPDRHQCNLCQMTFADASSLKRHGLVHKEGGDFPCEVCGKVLKKKDSLNDHMRIHTGEKPFQCQHCPYRGSSSSLLNHHVKSKHRETKHRCETSVKSEVKEVDASSDQETKPEQMSYMPEPSGHDENTDELMKNSQISSQKPKLKKGPIREAKHPVFGPCLLFIGEVL